MTTRQPRSVHLIKLDDIIADDGGPRPVDDAAVARLARSMAEIGLQTPISVVFEDFAEDNKGRNNRTLYRAVSGRHRIAAARSLGWAEIEAFRFDYDPVVDDSPEDADPNILAEMWAIAENLHRLDLTKEERDRQIRRYAELLTQRDATAVSRHDDAKLSVRGRANEGRPQGIASKVAEETGLSTRTVQRVLAEPKERPKPSPVAADPLNDFEANEKQVARLMAAWNAASPDAREEFLTRIDRPVMDRRYA